MSREQQCPICENTVPFQGRYPNYVCRDCIEEAPPVNSDGRRISYTNVGVHGGIQSLVDGSAEWRQDSDCEADCYVKGRQCRAEEGRFGGIVIQVVDLQKGRTEAP